MEPNGAQFIIGCDGERTGRSACAPRLQQGAIAQHPGGCAACRVKVMEPQGGFSVRNSLKIGLVLALVVGMFSFAGGPASADGTFTWGGNGFPNASCDANAVSMLWIFNDNGTAVPTSLTINGQVQTGSWVQSGNGAYKFTVTVNGTNYPPLSASITYTGTLGTNSVLTLSGCNENIPQVASLTVFKTIPNVLTGSETVTFTFQALIGTTVEGSCDITFTAGQTNGQCTITGLAPNTTYTIHEVPQAPWDTQPDATATTGAAGSNTAGPTFNNNFGPATAQACKVTDVDTTGHDASGDTFTFDLIADGDATPVETVQVAGGGTAADPVCEAFNTALLEGVTYTIVEETPPTGWTQDSLVCDVDGTLTTSGFTPDYPADADAQFTCTATNSITAAHATVRKVTIPAGSEAGFTFHLFADGVEVASWTSTDATAHDFGIDLQDGVHYVVTEDPVAEWNSDGGVGCDFTVSYPADSGRTFNCVFTNTHVSAGLTMGYWKNHLAANGTAGCSSLPRGTGCSKNGPFTLTYLPLNLGGYTVSTIGQAAAVFNAANCSSNTSQGAVACLAGQLLAAELNVANGASHCADSFITQANAFLVSIGYTGPTGTYTLTSAQRSTAISLKTALDTYNNGTCPV
jgi:hypothetical protein